MFIIDWDNVGCMVWEQWIQFDIMYVVVVVVWVGNDMIMIMLVFFEGVLDVVVKGLFVEDVFDVVVVCILMLKFELGFFENLCLFGIEFDVVVGSVVYVELNFEVVCCLFVLFENDGVLLFDFVFVLKVVFIGLFVDDVQMQFGDWVGGFGQVGWFDGQFCEMIMIVLDGLWLIDGWSIIYVCGVDIFILEEDLQGMFFLDYQLCLFVVKFCEFDVVLIVEVVVVVLDLDVVVVVVGDWIEFVGEGCFIVIFEFIGGQNVLIDVFIVIGKFVVIVLFVLKLFVFLVFVLKVVVVIWVVNFGMQGGCVLVDIIFGVVELFGCLLILFVCYVGQQLMYYNQICGQYGDCYVDFMQLLVWVFGEGLLYMIVEYFDLLLEEILLGEFDMIVGYVMVLNIGVRFVCEMVQVYVCDFVISVSWIDKEFKIFCQVDFVFGELVWVCLELLVFDCMIVDVVGMCLVEFGMFEFLVGLSFCDEVFFFVIFQVV